MAKSRLNKGISTIDTIFLDDPRRALVIGGFIVAAIILIVLFWGKIKGLFASFVSKQADREALNQVISETGVTPSLSNITYQALSQDLYQAMHGWGTNEETIYRVYNQLSNTADIFKLHAAFGVQDNKDLPTYIQSELNRREINRLNSILTGKGISYRY